MIDEDSEDQPEDDEPFDFYEAQEEYEPNPYDGTYSED